MEDLKNLLQNNVVVVKFKKVTGEIREMSCTLNQNLIPAYETKGIKKKNEDVLAVWALDKNAWRSFRLDSVIDFKVKEKV